MTMSSNNVSNRLRLEGNELYKSRDFLGAIKKYQEAAKLAPNDVSPLGNISAAYFEVGKYSQCVTRAEKALELLRDSPEANPAQVLKFEQRLEKAKGNLSTVFGSKQMDARIKILNCLGRYRPSMYTSVEYYTVGHDDISNLFDKDLVKASSKEANVSFFLGGVGDARHLYRTMIGIAEQERQITTKKKYHLTINDINKCALARDLILMILLDDLSRLDDVESIEAIELLTTVYFIFIGTMMPQSAFNLLHTTIDKALETIKAGEQPLSWLYLHELDMPLYTEALMLWKGPASTVFKSSEAIREVTSQVQRNHMPMFSSEPPTRFQYEWKLYFQAAVLIPPAKFLEKHDPEFRDLLRANPTNPKTNAAKFKDHLKANWKFNTTMMDVDWYNNLKAIGSASDFDLGHDPFVCLDHFRDEAWSSRGKKSSTLYEFIAPFFVGTAEAIKLLRGRLVIEMVHGDYVDAAEKIRFGMYRDSDLEISAIDPRDSRRKDFPTSYDRIHLSNVPDYMGGHLSTFLYAAPVLKTKPQGIIQSVCLRNSSTWNNIEAFLADYQAIPNSRMLEQLTQIHILNRGEFPMPMANYTTYRLAGPSLFRSFPTLLPQESFKNWFYTLFFRLVLPFNQRLNEVQTIVTSPLNLTILFRLMSHLQVIGYPSHWISELLSNILENNVTVTCRPPRREVTTPAALQIQHPEKKLCTTPFAPEMATLARLFKPLLPFQLTCTNMPAESEIYNYTFHLPNYNPLYPGASSFLLLVFWDIEIMKRLGSQRALDTFMMNLRRLLDPTWGDEVDAGFRGPSFERFREQGIVVWSTFTWDVGARKASAWMAEGIVDGFCEKGWACGLWRTDVWRSVWEDTPVRVESAVGRGERWGNVDGKMDLPIRVVN